MTNEMDQRIPLGFGGLQANLRDHIGHFFKTTQEWRSTIIPFFKTGLERGDTCVYVMSPEAHDESMIIDALKEEGVDAEQCQSSGQLILGEGKTTPDGMESWLDEAVSNAAARSSLVRWGGDMTWSLKKMPSSETLMKWECACNIVDVPAVYVCQYDLTQFLGSVIVDALKTHPLCIIGGNIHKNPYYVTPDDFLAELRSTDTQ
jgi:hypothetical protein